ncbi:MAG: phenylalanine--tRNA ligase subunit beta [Planctomycetota bacterium]|jgi:phenylalanyl-tRNA synthetase beta chain
MKASVEWLKEYVDFDLSATELAERLTSVGLPCEGIEEAEGDSVLELEVPSNRPDCLGMIGVAREVAAALGKELRIPEAELEKGGAAASSLARVTVEDQELCPRYVARVVTGVKIGPSPDWMQRRLNAVGLRPLNNVVDITNYVLMEAGQPLHAFDHDLLGGGAIIVRRSRPGEKMELIDGTEVRLDGTEVMIADETGPVALAGVMGGARTEVHSGTTNVLLESACFQASAIRRAARRLGVATESSYRFERAVDWNGVEYASRRAAALLCELAGGSVASGSVDEQGPVPKQTQITVRYWRVDKILGRRMEKRVIRRILMDLGLESSYESGEGITLLVPSFRPDLTREIDLIEEVARLFGYEHIPAKTELKVRLPRRNPGEQACRLIRERLSCMGFSETVTNSITSEGRAQTVSPWRGARPVVITNPPRADENLLRQSLLPSLLEVRRVNQAAGRAEVSVFDMGRVYLARPDGSVDERRLLAALDDRGGEDPEAAFSRLRAVLESVCGIFEEDGDLRVEPSDLPYMRPGESGRVFQGDDFLGVIGRMHDDLRKTFELRTSPAMLEIDLEALIKRGLARKEVAELPRFPGIRRDVALVVEEPVTWAQVSEAVAEIACDLRQATEFLNVYRGKQVGAGKKSLAMAVTYRSPERTLTDTEVNDLHSELVEHLTGKLKATLRS